MPRYALFIRFFLIIIIGLIVFYVIESPWPPMGYRASFGPVAAEQGKAFVAPLTDPALNEDGVALDSRLYHRIGPQSDGLWSSLCDRIISISLRPESLGCGGRWRSVGQHGQVHDRIRAEGAGRYSVWHGTLYFSAPDDAAPGVVPADGEYILWIGSPGLSLSTLLVFIVILAMLARRMVTVLIAKLCHRVLRFIALLAGLYKKAVGFSRKNALLWPSRPLMVRTARYSGLCLLGFAITGTSLRETIDWMRPLPETTLYFRTKIDWYRRHRDEIDTVFLGTSRVMRSIDPRIIDTGTAACGRPTHSFNFGVVGQTYLQVLAILEEIKNNPPKKLQYFIFEPRNNALIDKSLKSIYLQHFMTWKNFIPALHEALANPNNARERWPHFFLLIEMYLYHKLGIGISDEIDQEFILDRSTVKIDDNFRGFVPFDEITEAYEKFPPEYFDHFSEHMVGFPDNENGDAFKRRYATWIDDVQHKRADGEAWAPVFTEEFTYIDRIKAQKFALMPPSVYPNEPAIRQFFREKYPQVPVLFPDLLTFPALYNLDYWYDDGHLNHIGAKLYSQWVAEQLCQGAHP